MTRLKNLRFFIMFIMLSGFFVLNSANTCENKQEDKTEEAADGEHPNSDEHPDNNDEHPSNGDEEHPDN